MCPKLLLVTDSLANGGAERQLAILARYLPQEWDRRVWSWSEGPYGEVLEQQGVEVTVCRRRSRFDVTPGLRLWRDILEWQPDIVHTPFGWMSPVASAIPCRLLGIPLVDGRMRTGSLWRHGTYKNKLGLSFATRVIANSQAGLSALGIGPPRGRVIYNCFESRRLEHLDRRRPDGAEGRTLVVMAARMERSKDYATFIETARTLARDDPDRWLFLAIGDGVLMTDPRHLAEGCSNALMEYMACGLPCVASESGGNAELIEDGATGYIIPPRDAERLASRLKFLADHPTVAWRLGDAGRARSLSLFCEERFLREMASLYEEAITVARQARHRH
jgi:glycosyltransferase involved in cell wall biosynthesis